MNRTFFVPTVLVLVFVLAFASLAHSRAVPIQQYGHSGLSATYGKLTADQVDNAIMRAGLAKGWQMHKLSPGTIAGTLVVRNHSVTVHISYTNDGYSIKYHDSVNMKARGGMIHSSYNRWVEDLNRRIVTEIGQMKR